jgi:hypothetical protein
MNIENRTTWEVRVGVHATREQAEDLRNRIEALLCPDPGHRPPCPIPWSTAMFRAGSEYADLAEQYLIENLLEQIDTGVLRPGTLSQAARAAGYALYACELMA